MALSVVVDQSDKDDFEFAEVDEKTSERVGQVSSGGESDRVGQRLELWTR